MKWEKQHIDYLKKIANGNSTYKITDLFNKHFGLDLTRNQVRCAMQNRKITNGVDGRFKKGKVKDNGYRFTKNDPRGIPYRFKKGNKSFTEKPVGSIIEKNDGYLWKKIDSPDVWKPIHLLKYEEQHGIIPENHIVIFKDQNSRNFDIDNLVLITRKELAILNRWGMLCTDPFINQTAINIARLMLKKAETERKNNGSKHRID